jgi:hypothetical protein
MHHAHVKRKEKPMKPVTYEAMVIDPEIIDVLHARARQARAAAIQNLALRLIDWVAGRSSGGGHPFGIRWG